MKGAALTSFSPEDVTIIKDAYKLALEALEATGPTETTHEDALARAIITLAKKYTWKRNSLPAAQSCAPFDVKVCPQVGSLTVGPGL
jgi:hypothetical protein